MNDDVVQVQDEMTGVTTDGMKDGGIVRRMAITNDLPRPRSHLHQPSLMLRGGQKGVCIHPEMAMEQVTGVGIKVGEDTKAAEGVVTQAVADQTGLKGIGIMLYL